MKAAVFHAVGQPLTIEDLAQPQIHADEVLIQTKACGIDGTDLKMLDGFGYTPDLPFVMGHEIAGQIVEVGERVADFGVGDRVVVYNFVICGQCLHCRTFRDQLCQHMHGIMGIRNFHGGYAEYVRVPAQQLIRLPEDISWEDGAICCDAGLTAYHALDRARVRLGETLVIIGSGGVGAVLTQLAHAAGARVIAVDQTDEKQDWGLANGADLYLNNSAVDISAAVRDLTSGMGADCVIDVVGKADTLRAGVNALRPGGRIVVVGYTPDLYPLSGKQIAQNELEVIGTRAGRRQDLHDYVQLVAGGTIKSIVRHRYPLEHVNEALSLLRTGAAVGRIVLTY